MEFIDNLINEIYQTLDREIRNLKIDIGDGYEECTPLNYHDANWDIEGCILAEGEWASESIDGYTHGSYLTKVHGRVEIDFAMYADDADDGYGEIELSEKERDRIANRLQTTIDNEFKSLVSIR